MTNLTPPILMTSDDAAFRSWVDRDIRGEAPEVHDALRASIVVPRWFSVLSAMFRSVESQLASRKASHLSEMAKIESSRLDATSEEDVTALRKQELALIATFERSRSGSLRFKAGVETALTEARFLRDHFYPEMPVYKAERDELLRRLGRIEAGVERHRNKVLDENHAGSVDDEELWNLLPAEEIA